MEPTPCDKFGYNSDDYNSCIKDIVYEQAQDEWIMLDPRFPNIKCITPKRIDEFLANAETKGIREYFEDYLQHVMVYDRDDIVSMCYDLGQQIEKKYPGKLHSPHSIFVTTPRGGYEVLSIFAYTNDLKKEQIPSHFLNISDYEYNEAKTNIGSHEEYHKELKKIYKELINHYEENNYPVISSTWLEPVFIPSFISNKIETVFIIDDIIASGEQMIQAVDKIQRFFNQKVKIIPVVLIKRKNIEKDMVIGKVVFDKTLYDKETIGIQKWDKAQSLVEDQRNGYITPKPELIEDFDKLITVRFPWGSPDGESDKILTTLYESRRGLERIERKQRRCVIEPDKCELK